MTYHHTQIGHLTITICAIFIIFFSILIITTKLHTIFISTIIFIALIAASFATLTVSIKKQNLQVKFGYGIFIKNFPLKQITSVKIVKNHWYYGWGIRIWFWPKMWIYNISGFDAVEIKMKNGNLYRIGTDQPKKLKQAISKFI